MWACPKLLHAAPDAGEAVPLRLGARIGGNARAQALDLKYRPRMP
jgi:hypothetical protein